MLGHRGVAANQLQPKKKSIKFRKLKPTVDHERTIMDQSKRQLPCADDAPNSFDVLGVRTTNWNGSLCQM